MSEIATLVTSSEKKSGHTWTACSKCGSEKWVANFNLRYLQEARQSYHCRNCYSTTPKIKTTPFEGYR